MNILLLEREEIDEHDCTRLRDRRATHIREVLRASIGQTLRAGVIDGHVGDARIEEIADDHVLVRVQLHARPEVLPDTLLLAVPRPKVLNRMLAHAAALGFARIVLFRSWRVDKSWLQSTAMQPASQREQLLLGLEQAGRTQLPIVQFFDRFKPMVEDDLPRLELPTQRFVAHPHAATPTWQLPCQPADQSFALAIGPDGGFLPFEVDRLGEAGFAPISCGPHPLRTETALAVLTGQLHLLRHRE